MLSVVAPVSVDLFNMFWGIVSSTEHFWKKEGKGESLSGTKDRRTDREKWEKEYKRQYLKSDSERCTWQEVEEIGEIEVLNRKKDLVREGNKRKRIQKKLKGQRKVESSWEKEKEM